MRVPTGGGAGLAIGGLDEVAVLCLTDFLH